MPGGASNSKYDNEVHAAQLSPSSRISRMVFSASYEDARYNISFPPLQPRWMSIVQPTTEQYLVTNNVPVNFWLVGRIADDGAWLIGTNNRPFRFVSIRLRPIAQADYGKWKKFLDRLGGQTGQ